MAKKKTNKKTSIKAKSIKNISQIHGKAEEKNVKPSTLEQVWGDTGETKYGTMNEKEYVNHMKELNHSDLQLHASKVGIIPIHNREILQRRLLKEFQKHVASYKRPESKKSVPKLSKKAKDILAEGR